MHHHHFPRVHYTAPFAVAPLQIIQSADWYDQKEGANMEIVTTSVK